MVWGLAGLAVLAMAGLIAAAIAAARYQPLAFGDSEDIPVHGFPGLPVGRGIIGVNTFGYYREDIYVPPQRGAFSLFVTVANNGSRPVTIVSAAPPAGLRSAGMARYLASRLFSRTGRQVWRVLRDYRLGPGAEVEIGLPVRTSPCAQLGQWSAVPDFDVTMRFAGFTRTVPLPWGMSGDALIMRGQGGEPGEPGTFCLPGTVLPPPPPGSQLQGDQLNAVSGMIVRIHQAGTAGDLRLTRLPTPDAAGGFNNPACLVTRPPGQRVANFDLSWCLNLVAAPRLMPRARWQCLNFLGTGQQRKHAPQLPSQTRPPRPHLGNVQFNHFAPRITAGQDTRAAKTGLPPCCSVARAGDLTGWQWQPDSGSQRQRK